MRKVIWEVEVLSPPPVMKYCRKCGCKRNFVNSGCFRVNAQRKSLDVWLIYKCDHCDTTWNADVYTRVSPQALPPQLLEGFHSNDSTLAGQYAMDMDFLHRNGAEAGLPDYMAAGEIFSAEDEVELVIKSDYALPVKVSALVREKLKLSQKEYFQMVDSGKLRSVPDQDLRRCRVNKGITLFFSSF